MHFFSKSELQIKGIGIYGQLNFIIYIGYNCQSFWFGTLILSKNALFELKFPIEFTNSKICSIKQKKALILVILQYANDPEMKITVQQGNAGIEKSGPLSTRYFMTIPGSHWGPM